MFSLKIKEEYFSKTMSITRICLVKFFHFQTEFFNLEKFWNKFCKKFFFLKKKLFYVRENHTHNSFKHTVVYTHTKLRHYCGAVFVYMLFIKKKKRSQLQDHYLASTERVSLCVFKNHFLFHWIKFVE